MKAGMLVVIFVSIALFGCGFSFDLGGFGERVEGSGNVIIEDRPVSDFTDIDLLGSGVLIISQGDEPSLSVETDDNLMQYIKTEVDNGTLELSFTTQARTLSLQPSDGIVFRVTVVELEGLRISGSGTFTADSLECEMLVITLAGSGEGRIGELVADDLSLQILGSGDVGVSGVVEHQSFTIAGSGTIDAGDLQGETVVVTIPGSGSATVWAEKSLRVTIAGSGSVDYYGSASVSQSILGSGSVSSLGEK